MSEDIRDVNQTFIATKAIARARKNGWEWETIFNGDPMMFEASQFLLNKMYFNHDFAKAFWGEKEATLAWYHDNLIEKPYSFEKGFTWQVHLMKMVLEEHPIMYLKQFV